MPAFQDVNGKATLPPPVSPRSEASWHAETTRSIRTAVQIPLFPFSVAYLHTARPRLSIAAPFVSSPSNRCVYFSKARHRGLLDQRMNEGREGGLPHTRAAPRPTPGRAGQKKS